MSNAVIIDAPCCDQRYEASGFCPVHGYRLADGTRLVPTGEQGTCGPILAMVKPQDVAQVASMLKGLREELPDAAYERAKALLEETLTGEGDPNVVY